MLKSQLEKRQLMRFLLKRTILCFSGTFLLILLAGSFYSKAQPGNGNGYGNNGNDNGNHNGHFNPNNPNNPNNNIPIDQHLWLLLAGGLAIAAWQYRTHGKEENKKVEHKH